VLLLYGLSRRPASRPVAICVLTAALVCSAASIAALGWIVPASNQAFREEAAGVPVGRGTNELTLPELRAIANGRRSTAGLVAPAGAGDISLWYYARIAFSTAPLCLAVLALALVAQSRATRMLVGSVVLTSYFAYMFALGSEAGRRSASIVTPIVAAWVPNIGAMLVSLLAITLSRLKPAPTINP
jgi:lipopolysaccharide export LptBFGC system permease protein LptF